MNIITDLTLKLKDLAKQELKLEKRLINLTKIKNDNLHK